MAPVPLRVKKVQTNDRVLQQIQDAMDDFAKQVSVQLGAVSSDALPVGSIIGVHATKKGTPAIPATGSWVPMNGQTLHDTDSPYDGQVIENWNGTGRFLRGGSVSGVEQAADAVVPAHAHSLNNHTHAPGTLAVGADSAKVVATTGGAIKAFASTAIQTNAATTLTSNTPMNGAAALSGATAAAAGNTAADGGSGAETRPINASVIWYLRVK